MNHLQQVTQFLLTPDQKETLTIVISEHYNSEIEFLPGGEEVIVWEDGREWQCPVKEEVYAHFLVLVANFAIGIWGSEALLHVEEGGNLEIAARDIWRGQYWPEGNLEMIGGEAVLAAARSWPHYNSLEVALQPFVAAFR